MKERVTITIDHDIIKKIDKQVDGTNIKNRSHAIEYFLKKSLRGSFPTSALILAGGRGCNQKDMKDLPKALKKVKGKYVIEYNIELLKSFGITNIIVAVGYLKEKLKEFLKDGKQFGVNIKYIEESYPLGTGGPLKKAKDLIEGTFIMMNSDEIKSINLEKIYSFHLQNNALTTIALTTTNDPSNYGVALLDGNKIVKFVEKPPRDKSPSMLINAGLYIMESEAIDILPEGFSMVEEELFPKLAILDRLYGYHFHGSWLDTEKEN